MIKVGLYLKGYGVGPLATPFSAGKIRGWSLLLLLYGIPMDSSHQISEEIIHLMVTLSNLSLIQRYIS